MNQPSDEPDLAELLERAARYDEAGLFGKAALQLTNRALGARERRRLHRHAIGAEGRIAEDVVKAVHVSEPIWSILAERGLPEDASTRELADIQRFLAGRRTRPGDPIPHVSIRTARDPLRLSVVRSVVPGAVDLDPIDGYRFATLTDPSIRFVEPFLVLLHELPRGDNDVVASLHLGATFLRYEQQLGLVDPERVQTLATVVEEDLADIEKTHRALLEA